MSTPTIKRKRTALSINQKQEIIEKYDRGLKPKELASFYNVNASTISTIVSNKQKEKISEQDGSNAKRIRSSNYKEVEEHLNNWFSDCKSKPSVTIDGPSIKEQAIKIASLMNNEKFKASNHWLLNFNKRHNISLQKNNGEAGFVDKDAAKNYQLNVLPNLLKDYLKDYIFNADETALYYKAVPDRTYQYKNKQSNDIKVCKERLSILLCCNMFFIY